MSDLFNLYVQAGSPHGDDQPQSALRWASSEITALRQQLTTAQAENEALRARVAELEEGLHGIANCAYGYNHPKAQTADEAASWMNVEAMRLLGNPQPNAYVLRKQAEALEEMARHAKKWEPGEIFQRAQRLRTKANELEAGGGQ